MRLLILILLFPFIAHGQIVRTHPYYRSTAAPCTPLLLDTYSGAAAAYSVRLLDCDYAGSLIRVRRSSDNSEQDIGATANGDLDTATLKTFVGTGGSDNGFVVTRYDQSGNGYNATQSTASKQPYIVKSGVVVRNGTRPAIEGTAIDMYHATTATAFVTLPTHSSFSVFKQVTNTNNAGILVIAPSSGNDYESNSAIQIEVNTSPYNLAVQGGVGTPYNMLVSGTRTIYQLATHIISSGSGEIFQNGVSKGTDSYGSFAATNSGVLLIGQRYLSGAISSAYGFRGYISEIIVFNSDQSANRTAIESNINTYYSIY